MPIDREKQEKLFGAEAVRNAEFAEAEAYFAAHPTASKWRRGDDKRTTRGYALDRGETPEGKSGLTHSFIKTDTGRILMLSRTADESEYLGRGGFARVKAAIDKEGVIVPVRVSQEIDEKAIYRARKAGLVTDTMAREAVIRYASSKELKKKEYQVQQLGEISLSDFMKKIPPASVEERMQIAARVSLALARLHARNITHLDIKPENIMLKASGEVILVDYGLSSTLSGKPQDRSGTETYLPSNYDKIAWSSKKNIDLHALAKVMAVPVEGIIRRCFLGRGAGVDPPELAAGGGSDSTTQEEKKDMRDTSLFGGGVAAVISALWERDGRYQKPKLFSSAAALGMATIAAHHQIEFDPKNYSTRKMEEILERYAAAAIPVDLMVIINSPPTPAEIIKRAEWAVAQYRERFTDSESKYNSFGFLMLLSASAESSALIKKLEGILKTSLGDDAKASAINDALTQTPPKAKSALASVLKDVDLPCPTAEVTLAPRPPT